MVSSSKHGSKRPSSGGKPPLDMRLHEIWVSAMREGSGSPREKGAWKMAQARESRKAGGAEAGGAWKMAQARGSRGAAATGRGRYRKNGGTGDGGYVMTLPASVTKRASHGRGNPSSGDSVSTNASGESEGRRSGLKVEALDLGARAGERLGRKFERLSAAVGATKYAGLVPDMSWHDNSTLLVLRDGLDNAKGWAVVNVQAGDEGEKQLHVALLYVHRRGGGRGAQLLNVVEKVARGNGCTTVELTSLPRAEPFYRGRKFVPTRMGTMVKRL